MVFDIAYHKDLLFEINNNGKKNSLNTMVLDTLKLNCIINLNNEIPIENIFDFY